MLVILKTHSAHPAGQEAPGLPLAPESSSHGVSSQSKVRILLWWLQFGIYPPNQLFPRFIHRIQW